jgi:hypothetical protein
MGRLLCPGGCGYNGVRSEEIDMLNLLVYVAVYVAGVVTGMLVYRKNAATLEPVIDEVKKDTGA